MKRPVMTMWLCVVGMVLGASVISWAAPMGTATTYQGRLMDGDSPADGEYDFVFKLYDEPNDPSNQVGITVNVEDQQVSAGLFTVQLDFGSAVFDGEARWLAIGVRPGGETGDYTTLSPRQELTPTPYALYALNGPGSSGFWSAGGNDIYNTNSGNVGIGTTSPTGRLHVGTAAAYGDIIFFDAGSGLNDLMIDQGSAYRDNIDRVYIAEVTEEGSLFSSDKFRWSDDNGVTWSADINMPRNFTWYDLSHGVRIRWFNTIGHSDGGKLPGDTWAWVAFSSNENALVVKEGKVGIGTATPAWELEVANMAAGGGAESAVTADDASGAIAAYSSTLGAPFDHYAGRVSLFSDGATMGLDLRADSSIGDMRFYTGGLWPSNERMRITSTGGTCITSYRNDGLGSWEEGLYFANNSNLMGPWSHAGIWADGVSGYNGELVFGVDGDDTNNLTGIQEAMRISKSGNVGIGTDSPISLLEVVSDTGVHGIRSTTSAIPVAAYRTSTSGTWPAIHAECASSSSNATAIRGYITDTSPGSGSTGVLGVNRSTTLSGFGVKGVHDGYGIGVYGIAANGIGVYGTSTNGTYAGYFDGRVNVDVLEISGADVAEKFPSSEEVKPGMVVAIDPKHPGNLCLSREAYNRCVAGVVSGANGLPAGAILGHLPGNEEAPPIALVGRVWVRCDAAKHAIEPGDLLTTASTAGHAMKVTDYTKAQGAIIGKAMSSLKQGQGLVLVLVSLQ